MTQVCLRQIFYRSRPVGHPDVGQIVTASRRNNGIDGITGLLFFNGKAFLEVIEGSHDSVVAMMERICMDPRHRDIKILTDRTVEQREFPSWNAECLAADNDADEVEWRLKSYLKRFDPGLHHHFLEQLPFALSISVPRV